MRAGERAPQSEELRRLLSDEGQAWPAPIEWHATLPSTNDTLRELARAGAAEWSVVGADAQSAGRGRAGRAWISPPGNLFLSVLLRPQFEAVSLVPLLCGLAVAEAAAEWGVAAELKWPNDVLAGGRKLAGVLAEAASSGAEMDFIVVGVGANLLGIPEAHGPELRARSTSVAAEAGRAPMPTRAAAAVLGRVRVWYHALAQRGPQPVLDAWRARSVAWWGKRVEVVAGGRRLAGVARGVDERGALLVEGADGVTHALCAGEARELRAEEAP